MLFDFIIKLITSLIKIIPISVPNLPIAVTNILNKVNDLFGSSIGIVKVLLPWGYLSILLKFVLIFELGYFSYKFFILIFRFLSTIVLKMIEFTTSLVSKIGSFFTAFFGI